jgi:hypothetical protein
MSPYLYFFGALIAAIVTHGLAAEWGARIAAKRIADKFIPEAYRLGYKEGIKEADKVLQKAFADGTIIPGDVSKLKSLEQLEKEGFKPVEADASE